MNKSRIGLTMLLATLLGVAVAGEPVRKERPTQPFMRQKLDYSRGILEGITLERYDLIVTNAMSLRSMSITNSFFALRNEWYLSSSTNFQIRVDRLLRAAGEKDLEASTEAYTRVVRGCVECHKQFRLDQFKPDAK